MAADGPGRVKERKTQRRQKLSPDNLVEAIGALLDEVARSGVMPPLSALTRVAEASAFDGSAKRTSVLNRSEMMRPKGKFG